MRYSSQARAVKGLYAFRDARAVVPFVLLLMLVRPSELARFWQLHPKTVYLWIRNGRLRAVRTPGDHFRLRVEDVRAFCHANKLAMPPFLVPAVKQVLLIGAPASARVVRSALKSSAATVLSHPGAIDALLAAATSAVSLLVIDAAGAPFVLEDAVRALRRAKRTERTPIVVYNVPSAAKADAITRAGATLAIVRERDLGARLLALLDAT